MGSFPAKDHVGISNFLRRPCSIDICLFLLHTARPHTPQDFTALYPAGGLRCHLRNLVFASRQWLIFWSPLPPPLSSLAVLNSSKCGKFVSQSHLQVIISDCTTVTSAAISSQSPLFTCTLGWDRTHTCFNSVPSLDHSSVWISG